MLLLFLQKILLKLHSEYFVQDSQSLQFNCKLQISFDVIYGKKNICDNNNIDKYIFIF